MIGGAVGAMGIADGVNTRGDVMDDDDEEEEDKAGGSKSIPTPRPTAPIAVAAVAAVGEVK